MSSRCCNHDPCACPRPLHCTVATVLSYNTTLQLGQRPAPFGCVLGAHDLRRLHQSIPRCTGTVDGHTPSNIKQCTSTHPRHSGLERVCRGRHGVLERYQPHARGECDRARCCPGSQTPWFQPPTPAWPCSTSSPWEHPSGTIHTQTMGNTTLLLLDGSEPKLGPTANSSVACAQRM